MEKQTVAFSVADVYEHAASIGKDIECIVHQYGKEAIEDIMPKIVYVLEQLENLAERQQMNKEEIQELTIERDRMVIHSKRDEAIQRELEEKLSYMEGLVSNDKKELEQRLKVLQKENDNAFDELEKRDSEILKLRSNGGQEDEGCLLWCLDVIVGGRIRFLKALPGDVEVMMRMKTTIDGQRDQIRHLNHDSQSQRKEIEAMEEQISRLTDINERLRTDMLLAKTKLKSLEGNGNTISLPDLTDGGEQVIGSAHVKSSRVRSSDDPNSSTLSLQEELLAEDEFMSEMNTNHNFSRSLSLTSDDQNGDNDTLPSTRTNECTSTEPEIPGTRGIKDPNRPRYTFLEMQNVLEERNKYKIQMIALEDELQLYKESALSNKTSESVESTSDSRKSNKQSGVRTFMQRFLGK